MKKLSLVKAATCAGSLLLQLGAFSSLSQAAPGDVDLSFDPGAGLPGRVHAAALQPDGKVIVAGDYGIARLLMDGGSDRSFQWNKGIIFVGGNALAVQSDGKVFIGHSGGVARLNADGTTDTNFTATIEFAENSVVYTTAVQPNGKVLMGGSFDSINGTFRPAIGRLNVDGSLDSGFDPGAAVSGTVFAAALQSDGKVLIGGRLSTPSGQKSLLRLNADGSLDGTFATVFNPDDGVFSLAVQDDGRIVAGGYFSIGNHNNIVRLTANGDVDPDFQADATANDTAFAVRLQSDGKLLIAGRFTEMNGMPRSALARLNVDGSLDHSFNPGTNFDSDFSYNGRVSSLVVQPDGKLLIAGDFTEIGGVIREGFARLETEGSLDASFNPGGGVNSSVSSLLVQPDGKVLINGNFTSIDGVRRNGIARLNPDGRLDPAVFDRGTAGSSGRVTAMALQADGKVLIGTENGLARAHADGTPDSSFVASIGTGDDRSAVTSLAVQADGKILVAGYGNTLVVDPFEGGVIPWFRFHLTRLNADGSYDTSFERILGESLPNDRYYAQAMVVQPDGKILVAGYFFTFKGTNHVGIARINSDGSLDTGFNAGANNSVAAIVLQPDGKLFIGGVFTFVDGVSRRRIARLHGDGSLDTSWNPGTGAENAISAIALQSDGKLLVAGSFNTIDGTSRQRIARLNADGGLDGGFIALPEPDYVYTVALQTDGKVLMGGSFNLVNGVAIPHVARLYGNSVTLLPALNITRSNAFVVLSWPEGPAPAQLQQTASLSSPRYWSNVSQPAQTNAGQISVTVPMISGSGFFRLNSP